MKKIKINKLKVRKNKTNEEVRRWKKKQKDKSGKKN